jgi:hypothetical protein
MSLEAIDCVSMFLSSIPFLAIAAILVHFLFRRAVWKRNRRLGKKNVGYYPSAVGLGAALLFMQIFYRPSSAHAIEARLRVDAEEDDEGEPETPALHMSSQLKRIRRGKPVERLIYRREADAAGSLHPG